MEEWRVATVGSFEMLQKKTLKAFCASIRECATGITGPQITQITPIKKISLD